MKKEKNTEKKEKNTEPNKRETQQAKATHIPPDKNHMELYGIIGKPLAHSFSQRYFTEFFEKTHREACYRRFELDNIEELPALIQENTPLVGLNVTLPYKQKVIPYLHHLDEAAAAIGAVNVVRVTHTDNKTILTGHNTDYVGFRQSIKPLLKPFHRKALILGTGGASKAVNYALRELGLQTKLVSRTPTEEQLPYDKLTSDIMEDHLVIVNTTPLGTYPDVNACADIPYAFLSNRHLCYDLVYNPEKTLFLQKSEAQGAITKNGLEMLHLQAKAAWEIWKNNKP